MNLNSFSGLSLLLLTFACVPVTVRAATTKPGPKPQPPAACSQASVQITGIFGITGSATFKPTTKNPKGIDVSISATGLRQQQHTYHIHLNAADISNCNSAGKNYDPTNLKKLNNCPGGRIENQNKCEVGDLSGKGGFLAPDQAGATVSKAYTDTILQFSDIKGRSLVIHDAKGDFIACGNVVCQP
ncbi:hypothetical protein PGT21_003726 [Puccinia graminis f. sp. tritici]|uniref:Superoxide dismutase copper/zinc binding domain-containing protein n=1 Tax=Puccinia graminis f. sp. tritici TaxID=56615 RepID=A0A5B0NQV4_PUCGR|nr:hypothetical protein PGTUg99_032676 [Puccinia graminis f. sp. tritici]KAA1090510.1 hypothetical protein PGT21_003726 [Puccinia graminis f. sp. tritici]